MTAAEFLTSKCSGQSLPPEFDHLDMSLLCHLAGKGALAAAWARRPCAVVGVTDRYWRSLVTLASQRVNDRQIAVAS